MEPHTQRDNRASRSPPARASRSRRLALALLPALLAGCIESQQVYIVNPNGTGRVHVLVRTAFLPEPMSYNPNAAPELANHIIKHSQGIDTWGSVEFHKTPEGYYTFRGVGYFEDVQEVKIDGGPVPLLPVNLEFQIYGRELSVQATLKTFGTPPNGTVPSNEETASTTESNTSWLHSYSPYFDYVSALRSSVTVWAPGRVTRSGNFQAAEDGSLVLPLIGERFTALARNALADPQVARQLALYGHQRDASYRIHELLFGTRTAARVTVRLEPKEMFDYEAEVAKARASESSVLSRARIRPAAKPAPRELSIRSVQVLGVRTTHAVPEDPRIRPFGDTAPNYTLELLATFHGVVRYPLGYRIAQAQTEDGTSLLGDFAPNPRTMAVAQNQRQIKFTTQLLPPPPGQRSLERLAGTLEYIVSDAVQTIYLGTLALSPAPNQPEGTTVLERRDEELSITIRVPYPHYAIKSVEFVSTGPTGGQYYPCEETRSWWDDDNSTVKTIRFPRGIPPEATVQVTLLDAIQVLWAPFEIGPVSLLGQ